MSFSNKLYLSRPVILDILSIRGYDTSDYNNISFEEIDIMLKNAPSKNKDKSPLDIELNNETSKILVKNIFWNEGLRFLQFHVFGLRFKCLLN